MAALHNGVGQMGQIAQHGQPGLPLQQGGKQLVQTGGAVVEEEARQMTRRPEIFQPVDLSRQRHTGPFGLDHQQNGEAEGIRQRPRACGGGTVEPVIKAHGSLAEGGIMPGGIVGVQGPHRVRRREEQVEVVAVHPESGAVEHRVDVVGPGFEGAGRKPTLLQRRQQGTGQGGLSAAGSGGRKDELDHFRSPVIRKMGLLAIRRWSLPAGLVRLTASWVTSAVCP